MNSYIITLTLLLAAPLFASVGCSSLNTGGSKIANSLDIRRAMWWKSEKPEPRVPGRLVSTWTDTVLNKPGQKSQRGFGGRLVFFDREEADEPVCVDGQLVVYAYDEANVDPRTARPTRRYIFPREQFARHYGESSLGPSYSVWLPWDEVGGQRKNISLIARFEPHGGPLIAGEQTRHLLPGTPPPEAAPRDELPSMRKIQLVQHSTTAETEPAEAQPAKSSRRELTSTSIRLSQHWRDRLASRPTSGSCRKRLITPTSQSPAQPPTPPVASPVNPPPPAPR